MFLKYHEKKADCFVDYSLIKSIHGTVEILFPLPGEINCLYVSITHITLALSH